jgi:hypothetical protein
MEILEEVTASEQDEVELEVTANDVLVVTVV